MGSSYNLIVGVAVGVVFIVLLLGLANMARGGSPVSHSVFSITRICENAASARVRMANISWQLANS